MNVSFVVVLIALGLADRPDLVGRVVTPEGHPVPGAHALIDSASVREGTSALCQSCYADCRKTCSDRSNGPFPHCVGRTNASLQCAGRRRRIPPGDRQEG